MRGHAPGWQLRCPKCGDTYPAADAGIIRIGAWSRGKRVFMRCRAAACERKRRWMHLERVPNEP